MPQLKYILLLCLSLITLELQAQEGFEETFEGSSGQLYDVYATIEEDGGFEIKVKKQGTEEADTNSFAFRLNPMQLTTFKSVFAGKMEAKLKEKNIPDFEDKVKTLFYNIIAYSLAGSKEDAPRAGFLTIQDSVLVYKGNNCKPKDEKKPVKVKVTDVSIEFLEGFIELIKIEAEDRKGEGFRFENKYGIGFSTRGNYKMLYKTCLYNARDTGEQSRYIVVGDLLDYSYETRLKTKDFSPANQMLNTYGGKRVELKKDANSRILEFLVFSDFLGIEQDNPNGLIQVEFEKRINLNTHRLQTFRCLNRWFAQGIGFFQFVRPALTLSKIEENNRALLATPNDSIRSDSTLASQTVINPVEVLNHQNLAVGLDLNLFMLDNSAAKFHAYLNLGFRFGRTQILDSLRRLNEAKDEIIKTGNTASFGINYFLLHPEFSIEFLPDERYGLTLSYRPQYFVRAFDSPRLQTQDRRGEVQKVHERWIHTFELLGYLKTSKQGKLFARWRFNHQAGNINQNFYQLQLGYSMYFTAKRKE